MSNGPLTKLGIVRCRDLVQLYYGARVVTNYRETVVSPTANIQTPLIPGDPSRISYVVVVENLNAAAQTVDIGSQQAIEAGTALEWSIPPNETIVFEQDWRTELDAVTTAQFCVVSGASVLIAIRETYLSPLPVDESV